MQIEKNIHKNKLSYFLLLTLIDHDRMTYWLTLNKKLSHVNSSIDNWQNSHLRFTTLHYGRNYQIAIKIYFFTCSWHQKNETTNSPIHQFKNLKCCIYNLFTTSESPNIRIPILQIFVFIYWRGTRKHFSLVQKIFSTNKKCFLVPLQ